MITENEKISFKETLGAHYSIKVQDVLRRKGIKDSSGKTHSRVMIRQVMNGETSHVLIEEAIVTAVEEQLKENEVLEQKKAKLLKSAS